MPLTKLEIINETVEYYLEHERATFDDENGQQCRYYLETDNGYAVCAVGRCFENPEEFENVLGAVDTFDEVHGLENNLQPKYRGHDLEFWNELQNLHDQDSHWCADGLTPRGEQFVDNLRKAYA